MNKYLILIMIWMIPLFGVSNRQDFSQAFIDVARESNPAVVSILSKKVMQHDFHQFFFSPQDDMSPFEQKGQTLGSGVIIDAENGYIVTNNHVIENAEDIKVTLLDKREIDAEIIGTDPLSDLAVLQIVDDNLYSIDFGNSDKLQIGEWVVAIGSPFGLHLNHTVTAGIVSAKGRSDVISRVNFENFIQHDAAINPGNSGGALLNLDGELVGINTAIATDGFSKGNAGVGFAIPVNQMKRVVDDLIENGQVSRGWMGVSIQDIDENMARALDIDSRNGAIIINILPDSPAEESDLQDQDIIVEINGEKIKDASHLKNMVAGGHPNDRMRFAVIRDGKKVYLSIKLGTRPEERDLYVIESVDNSYDILGLKVKDPDINIGTHMNREKDIGVYVDGIKKGSAAQKGQIRQGDIIINIGREELHSVSQYHDLLNDYKKGDSILLLIKRDSGSRFVALEIE